MMTIEGYLGKDDTVSWLLLYSLHFSHRADGDVVEERQSHPGE